MRNLFFFFLVLPSLFLQAEEKKTICLSMIVKNESQIIKRCLEPIKKIIDYWVIIDTGSNDGTQKIIQEFMSDVPGELIERPWVDFAHNRNESLAIAKSRANYTLLIDADETLIYSEDFELPKLEKDYYFILSRNFGTTYPRKQLISNALNWKWEGVLHEHITCSEAQSNETLPNVINQISWDGCRSSDPEKYAKDAIVLEKALLKDPDNRRYVFYLAQSYRDSNQPEKALKAYLKRVSLAGGFHEEIYWSLNEAAKLKEQLGKPFEEVTQGFLNAHLFAPKYAEPLFFLAKTYKAHNQPMLAYLILKYAQTIPPPKDYLFIEHWIYDFGILLEIAECACQTYRYREAQELCNELMKKSCVPTDIKEACRNALPALQEKLDNPPTAQEVFKL